MSNIVIRPERISNGTPLVEFTGSGGGTSKIEIAAAGGINFTLNESGQQYSFSGGPVSVESIIITDDLTVNGTTTTINSVNLEIKDAVVGLGFASGTIAEAAGDRGFIGGISGADNVTLLWKNAATEFALGRTQSSATGSLPIALSSYSNLHVANLQASIVTASLGFSGSLTRLTDGGAYLRAGPGIDIATGSGGWIEISSSVTVSPASPDRGIQYNDNGSFGASANFTFEGDTVFLTGSLANGNGSIATGLYAHAEGNSTIAFGQNSHAEGNNAKTGATNYDGNWSGGNSAHAEGEQTNAFGQASHTEGYGTKAGASGSAGWSGGNYAHAEGYNTTAFGGSSHTEGTNTKTGVMGADDVWSGGLSAHAEGENTIAFGDYSHAEGSYAKTGASGSVGWSGGNYAHAEGEYTIAYGNASHAEGNNAKTGVMGADDVWGGGDYAHAEGEYTIAFGQGSHAEGAFTKTGASGSAGWSGGGSAHAEGNSTTAFGQASHTEGNTTKTGVMGAGDVWSGGQYAHAEGDSTIAFGLGSHAEGQNAQTGASGSAGWSGGAYAHAEGAGTIAFGASSHAEGNAAKTGFMGAGDVWTGGDYAHAEGDNTIAFGQASHAEGYYTTAIGDYSHAAGYYTIASGSSGQAVVGKYNKRDNTDSLFVVGNGDADANGNRSDIFLVNTGSVLVGSASLAADMFFYVGTKGVATNSRFDGSMVVSGTFDVKNGLTNSVLSVSGSRVGINTSSPGYALEVNGDFAALTKSFVINHPSKPGWKLRYGSLEGPENGVYVRGRTSSSEIILPEYWANLVDENSITVNITPIRSKLTYFVSYIGVDKVCVEFDSQNVEYCYLVQASRKDETFVVEFPSS